MGSRAVQHPMRLTTTFLVSRRFRLARRLVSSLQYRPDATRSGNPATPEEPVRQISTMRWGLIPNWARDASIASGTISAKFETVANKPAFRDPLRLRRCSTLRFILEAIGSKMEPSCKNQSPLRLITCRKNVQTRP